MMSQQRREQNIAARMTATLPQDQALQSYTRPGDNCDTTVVGRQRADIGNRPRARTVSDLISVYVKTLEADGYHGSRLLKTAAIFTTHITLVENPI
jgi:hypothetical protein